MVAAAALLWSTGGIAIKAAPEPALVVSFYRSAFAALALAMILRPRWPRLTPTFVAALVSYAACLTTFVVATKWTTAANAIFLQYSGVIWVLLAAPWITKDPLNVRDAVAVTLALLGMALFFVGKLRAGGAGDFVALASGVFFACLVLSLRLERGAGAEAAVTLGNVLAALSLLPFVIDHLAVPRRSLAILLFLGVVQLACAYALFVQGLRHVTATQASLIGMLEPICNPIWVFLLLGERPGLYAILGGVIVLGAVAWRTFGATPAAARVAPTD
jgi:drug/metabolite transporter (DMT)-like permease